MKAQMLALSLATSAMLGSMAWGQKSDIPLVTTTGSAEIKVVPDLADLRFEVEVRNLVLAVARKAHGERMKRLIAAMKAAGVEDKELKTSQVIITPVYKREERSVAETDTLHYFSVNQTLNCTIKDPKKVPDLTSAAVEAGATSVGAVQLRSSQLRKYRDEARAMAVKAAKEKAMALTEQLGSKIGKPHQINENYAQAYFAGFQNTARAGAAPDEAGESNFVPGTISITAEVTVSFVIE